MERLQKALARAGIASRRGCEELIRQGRVKVNGQVIKEMGIKINPEADRLEVDGRILTGPQKKAYYMLYKPAGYVTTVKDPQNRNTVLDLLPKVKERVYPVGRLDMDTEGLLLLTNDGLLAQRLMHPRYKVDKVYWVLVKGHPDREAIQRLRRGVLLEDGWTSPAKVELKGEAVPGQTALVITIREGRKRQIKRMCKAVGHPVVFLKRIKLGTLMLGELRPGEYRPLTDTEVRELKNYFKGIKV